MSFPSSFLPPPLLSFTTLSLLRLTLLFVVSCLFSSFTCLSLFFSALFTFYNRFLSPYYDLLLFSCSSSSFIIFLLSLLCYYLSLFFIPLLPFIIISFHLISTNSPSVLYFLLILIFLLLLLCTPSFPSFFYPSLPFTALFLSPRYDLLFSCSLFPLHSHFPALIVVLTWLLGVHVYRTCLNRFFSFPPFSFHPVFYDLLLFLIT